MEEAPEMEVVELRHVAALCMAIWIYLMRRDESAREEISKIADVLAESLFAEDVEVNDEQG